MTTYACVSCGGTVAGDTRRCPHCGGKRPAPTVGNLVRTALGLAVLIIVLVAMFGGFHSNSTSASSGGASPDQTALALSRLNADDGVCLDQAGVSRVGAFVQIEADGTATVTLGDGAVFTVPADGGTVVDGNPQADHDMLGGTADCLTTA